MEMWSSDREPLVATRTVHLACRDLRRMHLFSEVPTASMQHTKQHVMCIVYFADLMRSRETGISSPPRTPLKMRTLDKSTVNALLALRPQMVESLLIRMCLSAKLLAADVSLHFGMQGTRCSAVICAWLQGCMVLAAPPLTTAHRSLETPG